MSARPNAQLRRQQVLAERAAEMRATPTRSEQALWEMLRAGKLGAPVRRQVVLGQHVVDFLVPACRLVIEVDGGYHRDRRVADARRERALRRLGYRVLRLSSCPNSQVLLAPLRVSRSASLRARARLRSSPSSGFARAGKTSRSEPGVSSLSHARLVVPRPGAVVGLRSTRRTLCATPRGDGKQGADHDGACARGSAAGGASQIVRPGSRSPPTTPGLSSCPNSPPLRGVGLPQTRASPERGRRAAPGESARPWVAIAT